MRVLRSFNIAVITDPDQSEERRKKMGPPAEVVELPEDFETHQRSRV
jgi:hypothetical protein